MAVPGHGLPARIGSGRDRPAEVLVTPLGDFTVVGGVLRAVVAEQASV
ncbi:hypothetical protein [Streptosporangium sp. KLBMP 9127]|nr:hypothetical protein [Streptosporangium sp. KLBMP 9127]